MLDLWNNVSLALFDALLGWLLSLPVDFAIIILALLTAGLMVLVRPLTTNQEMLGRVARDNRRLKMLMREARKRRDREALLRYKTTSNRLSLKKLSAEGKPLLISIIPIAMLATWAMNRLEFHPPMEGETVEVVTYTPLTSVDEIIHLVPQPGLEAANGWVQQIAKHPNEPTFWDRLKVRLWNRFLGRLSPLELRTPEPDALAKWQLKGKANPDPYALLFRFRDQTIEGKLIVGQPIYAPALTVDANDSAIATQIVMREVRFFGIPGLGEWLPGWLVGYLIVVFPLVFFLKWALTIY
jgi:uncharacterized membrane protein (DUF106 family)